MRQAAVLPTGKGGRGGAGAAAINSKHTADLRDQILAKKTPADNYRWLAGKLNPHQYGDQVKFSGKVDHQHTHTVDLRSAILMARGPLKVRPVQ